MAGGKRCDHFLEADVDAAAPDPVALGVALLPLFLGIRRRHVHSNPGPAVRIRRPIGSAPLTFQPASPPRSPRRPTVAVGCSGRLPRRRPLPWCGTGHPPSPAPRRTASLRRARRRVVRQATNADAAWWRPAGPDIAA